jgi:hypothetical protein
MSSLYVCDRESCNGNNVHFETLKGLNVHLRRVHNETVESIKHSCSKCSKEFTDKSAWRRHEPGCRGTKKSAVNPQNTNTFITNSNNTTHNNHQNVTITNNNINNTFFINSLQEQLIEKSLVPVTNQFFSEQFIKCLQRCIDSNVNLSSIHSLMAQLMLGELKNTMIKTDSSRKECTWKDGDTNSLQQKDQFAIQYLQKFCEAILPDETARNLMKQYQSVWLEKSKEFIDKFDPEETQKAIDKADIISKLKNMCSDYVALQQVGSKCIKVNPHSSSVINNEKQELLKVAELEKQLYDQIDSYLTLHSSEWISSNIKDLGSKLASIIYSHFQNIILYPHEDKLLFEDNETTIEFEGILKIFKQIICKNSHYYEEYSHKLFRASHATTPNCHDKYTVVTSLLTWIKFPPNSSDCISSFLIFETQIKLGIREYFESLHKIGSEHRDIPKIC